MDKLQFDGTPNGYIDISDDVAFGTMAEVCNQFGHSYKAWRRGLARHPYCPELTLWFPNLRENDEWLNRISDDECVIHEEKKTDNESFIEESLAQHDQHRRIVFARLGDTMYHFKGVYEVDVEASRRDRTITYNRIATRVQTYRAFEKVA